MTTEIRIDDIRDKFLSLNQSFGQRLAMLTVHECDIDSDKYLKEIKRGIESTKWFLQQYGAWSESLQGKALRIIKPYYKHAMEVRNERILARIEQREERVIQFEDEPSFI